ncbi:unnamed protein product [Pedinophyceae sp. YPF-701]|nr:unnamed protein product [Pedinophyceae sp. YPF-701]
MSAHQQPSHLELMEGVRAFIPPLGFKTHKGQSGKIGIIGGSQEYTGAPFFAGLSALRAGADLAHVFCTQGAAQAIKSYSPELIVHPYLPPEGSAVGGAEEKKATEQITSWLKRFTCIVVGPGLGRDPVAAAVVQGVVREARRANIPLVIDADGLWILNQHPELVKGYKKAVVTPNAVEFKRLAAALGVELTSDNGSSAEANRTAAMRLAAALDGPVVVQKGYVDTITDGEHCFECRQLGVPRRCGGLGDILSGSTATFVSWADGAQADDSKQTSALDACGGNNLLLAAYAACALTRVSARQTFRVRKRSMLAGDVIDTVGSVFAQKFEIPAADPDADDDERPSIGFQF